ncbi:MAG: hypothetical protein HND58_13765 [Planctomycetota bacterium]|nr:MAG: hypothetical protein HND58_13765 [Planctomycetota bacterium]
MTTPHRNPINAPHDHGRLRLLLDEQETLFVRLDALSKRQQSLVESERTDELLRVLTERQTVIDGIAGLARELQPFRDQWEAVLAEAKPEQRDRLAQQVERMADLAALVATRDDADRKLMERRRDSLAGELAGTGRSKGAVAAYAGATTQRPAAKFQDREA